MIKGIIFDLDGTLLNSLKDLQNSVNRVLINHGFEPHPTESYKKFVGNGVRKLVERAFETDYEFIDAAFDEFLNDYNANCTVDSVLYEGIYELLKELNKRNIPIAINTNKAQTLCDKILKHYFKGIEFTHVIGDRFDGLRKPNPHYPLYIANEMLLAPASILFVGDSDVDMLTAQAGGFIPIGVSWGFRTPKELKANGASQIIDSPGELLRYFEK